MTFLTPIPALIAASLAVPTLLLLYFLRLRRRPVRVSSTMFWEEAVRDLQVNVPWRLIRPSWLLMLQLLALGLLLAALGRPVIPSRGPEASKIVLLVDASASMSARDGADSAADALASSRSIDGSISRLEQAKARARQIITRALEGERDVELGVVVTAREARLVQPLTSDRRALESAIEAIEPTDQPADLAQALALCGTLLASPEGEETRATPSAVHLISDGSFAPPVDGRGFVLPGAMLRYEPVGPRGAPDAALDDEPGAAGGGASALAVAPPVENLGIVALAARREPSEAGAIRVFARIQNAGAATAAKVIMTLNGQEIRRQALDLPGRSLRGEPGQAVATFQLGAREAGLLELRLDHEDLLASDDAASIMLAERPRTRVLLVIPDGAVGDETKRDETQRDETQSGPHWVIADVLRELPGVVFRQAPASAYAASNPASLDADVVIFDRVVPARRPAVASIHFGAVPMFSESSREPGQPEGVGSALIASEPIASSTPVVTWSRSHPTLRDVSLDTVQVEGARWLSWSARPAVESAEVSRWSFTELARGTGGSIIVEALERPAAGASSGAAIRRLIVSFELARSTWPLSPSFAIFLASAVEALGPGSADQAGQAWTTREPIELKASGPGEITLVGAKGRSMSASIAGGTPTALAVFPPPARVGIYRVQASPGSITPIRNLAVNLVDELESAAAVMPAVRVNGAEVVGDGAGSSPRELWPLFVLLAGVLLLMEWVLSAWWMRV
jgi:Aerotolerance regulator N-terminal/von Willebrand factor type A domain